MFGSGVALPTFQLTPLNAIFGSEKFPILAKHSLTIATSYGLMFGDSIQTVEVAHFYGSLPTGISFTGATFNITSRQGSRTTGTVGWHVGLLNRANGQAFDAAHASTAIVYPATVAGTAGQTLVQTEDLSVSGWAAGDTLRVTIQRMGVGTDTTAATERTTFMGAAIRLR